MEKFEFCEIESDQMSSNHDLSDFSNALKEAVHLQDECEKYLIQFRLTADADHLFILFGNVNTGLVRCGGLRNQSGSVLTSIDVISYLRQFHSYFADFPGAEFRHDKELISLVIKGLHLFYLPFFSNLAKRSHIIFHVSSDVELNCQTDLSQLYNLHFLLIERAPTRNDFIVSQATTAELSLYVRALASLKKPVPSDVNIIFGLFPLGIEPENITQTIYKKAMESAVRAGATVHEFSSVAQVSSILQGSANVVQIIGHFHYGRLIMNGTGIRLKTIKELIGELNNKRTLNNALIIDGINCTNFEEFKSLYDVGVKLVYSSFNDLNSLLIGFLLFEMYSAKNANALGITSCYLDGKTYLHEVYDLITRILIHISAIRKEKIYYE